MDLTTHRARKLDLPIVGDRDGGTFAFAGDETAAILIEAGSECANDTLATPARVIFYRLATGVTTRGPCADQVMPFGKNGFALSRWNGEDAQTNSTDLGATWTSGRIGGFWDEAPIEVPLENRVIIAGKIYTLPERTVGAGATFSFTR